MLDGVLLVGPRLLESFRMPLHESHPLDLLLEEAEGATGPRSPFVIARESETARLQDVDHARLVDAGLTEGQRHAEVGVRRCVALSIALVRTDRDVTDHLVPRIQGR